MLLSIYLCVRNYVFALSDVQDSTAHKGCPTLGPYPRGRLNRAVLVHNNGEAGNLLQAQFGLEAW